MEPFVQHTGRVAVMPAENIDTDQILPARFLKKPRSAGYDTFLFDDLRRDAQGNLRDDFPLHVTGTPPSVLVAGHNFGCGSSREGAVYALADAGFRVVIATAIADIFQNNAISNGLLPIELDADAFNELLTMCDVPAPELTVDLTAQTLTRAGAGTIGFDIDAASRHKLLEGRDDITDTLTRLAAIEDAEAAHHRRYPWSRGIHA